MSGSQPNPATEAAIEDVLWLTSFGVHPEHIAARVGKSPAAIETMLRRRGMPEHRLFTRKT